MFWTRLGTPTGEGESGTAEEIDRAGRAGKRVLMYFSTVPINPEDLDLVEYQRLLEFKRRTYPKGLIEKYGSLEDFRARFVRQLGSAVLSLIADDRSDSHLDTPSGIDLRLAFAAGQPLRELEQGVPLTLSRIICVDESDIPDYQEAGGAPLRALGSISVVEASNKDYYRDLVSYYAEQGSTVALRIAVANEGQEAVRDIHMEINCHVREGVVDLLETEPTTPRKGTSGWLYNAVHMYNQSSGPELLVSNQADGAWSIQVDLPVVQSGRSTATREGLLLKATKASHVDATATIYSSSAPPFKVQLALRLDVREREMGYLAILDEFDPAAGAEVRKEPSA